ncbi:hypothetical protein [Halobacillus seohaensis]|uniref:Uncharacterized protein n=1 Tax=Halobacillus seohaensis TaxID=447421 RepID=A0ABW2EHK8_9BACI
MANNYYWFAWFTLIIILFFLNSRSKKRDALLFYILIQMIMGATVLQPEGNSMVAIILHVGFGLYFWAESKPLLAQFWPVLFIFLWTLVHLFLLTNPVWYLFPGTPIGLIVLIYLINKLTLSLSSQIGLWVLMNTLGLVAAYFVSLSLSVVFMMDVAYMHATIIKGMVLLLLFGGVSHLKISLVRYKRSRKKRKRKRALA